jgi:hypothetical protein
MEAMAAESKNIPNMTYIAVKIRSFVLPGRISPYLQTTGRTDRVKDS